MNGWLKVTLISWLIIVAANAAAVAMEYELSGHLRGQGSLGWYQDDHVLAQIDDNQFFVDGSIDGRLNSDLFFSENISFQFAYEIAASGGQTRRAISKLDSDTEFTQLLGNSVPSDDGQFFDFTKVFSEEDEFIAYHRIDRLFLSVISDFGTVKAGRQALTWGNGMVFNPADLINPFAPADIVRDYKIGTDMILYQVGGDLITDFQLVYVPRRNPDDGELEVSQATFGAKLRATQSELDVDLYLVRNYEDLVLGTGITGFWGGAVYRTDLTLTYLEDDAETDHFFSAVANLDYSWVKWEKNWYGSIELYYNGLGADNFQEALEDEALVERIVRGGLFVTGKYYFDATLQYEAHPLINCFISAIINLEDLSLFLQPRLVWDLTSSTQILCGVNLLLGGAEDEFGELKNPETSLSTGRPVQGYLLATWFF